MASPPGSTGNLTTPMGRGLGVRTQSQVHSPNGLH